MRAMTATIATVFAVLWPAAAQAYEVHISITGAGQVTETTDANLVGTGCITSANNPTGSVGVHCYPGDLTGAYDWGWTVRYVATARSGYRFVQWQSDGTPKPVICDNANGSSTYTGSACQFGIFDNLQTRAVFEDVTSPSMAALSGPNQAVNGATTFTFSAVADPTVTGYECRVVNVHDWVGCSSGRSEDPASGGTYTFEVRAVDASGNKSPISTWGWTVDKLAPDTSIGQGPSGTVTSTSASFDFTSNEQGTFQCRLDAGVWATCSSPKAYSSLALGQHTFDVRAADVAGNQDATWATRTWTIAAATTGTPTDPGTSTNTSTTTNTGTTTDTGTTTNPVTPPVNPPVATPFDPRITSLFAYKGAKTRFTQLVVTRLPKGAKVQVVCAGKGCAFKRKSVANKGAKLNVLKALKRLTLRSGAVLQLRITGAAGELKVATWKVRRGRAPSTTYRCAATRGAKLRTCT